MKTTIFKSKKDAQIPFVVGFALSYNGSDFVVLYYVFSELYELFSYPKRFDNFKIRAKCDQDAQKLLYVVKFANVFVSRLLGDYEILEIEHGELVGDLNGCGVWHLHLHEGAVCLYRRA